MSSHRRVRKILIPASLIAILAVSMSAALYLSQPAGSQAKDDPKAYVGVAFGGNTTQQAEVLIDKVKSYTNLFILDSGRNPISENQTKVEEICDYAVSRNLSVIVNLGIKDAGNSSSWGWFWNQPSLDAHKAALDRPMGKQILGHLLQR